MSQVFLPDPPRGEMVPTRSKQRALEAITPSDCPHSYFHYTGTLDDITAQLQLSCRSCTARKKVIMKFIPEAAMKQSTNFSFRWNEHDVTEQGGETVIRWSTDTGTPQFRIIETFFLENEHPSEFNSNPFNPSNGLQGLSTRRPLPSDTSTDTRIQFAMSCVRTCIKEHADCESNSLKTLPTRVLFVGTTESPAVYLHESTGETSQYVCLSYCWGKQTSTSSMLQTTTGTIDQFKTQIAWSQLPRTFRDAIYVTRMLKVKYIWIDSLCIIQDDMKDKAQEIGQMAVVYSNAFLTIAATSASSPVEGLFNRASGLHTAEQLPKSAWDPEWSAYGPLYAQLNMPHVWGNNSIYPLLKRAWVFQERILSRRVLHFTREEMAWECMSASGCECGIPEAPYKDLKRNFIPSEKRTDLFSVYHAWAKVIWAYSSLRLTYDGDILPGISGLATVFNIVFPDQYLCGLWRSSLLQGLCWKRFDSIPKSPTYLAPSWSWASSPVGAQNSVFMNTSLSFRELAHISDVCCVPIYAADPTGMVSSGYLRLSAKATPEKLGCEGLFTSGSKPTSVSLDNPFDDEERDVYVVAIGISSGVAIELEYLNFLVLASNGDHPETFQRLGHSKSYRDSDWTDKEWEWWTSRGGDGWTEFTIV